jgi:hypothetical protein
MAEMKKFEIQIQDIKYLLAEPRTVRLVCLKPGISSDQSCQNTEEVTGIRWEP